MAKESLLAHPKFLHLCSLLKLDAAQALGHLEMLFLAAHARAQPGFRTASELEAVAHWRGKSGALAGALRKVRLVDARRGGIHELHDYWDHCPRYVLQRRDRAEEAAPNSAVQRRSAPKSARARGPDPDPDPDPGSDRNADPGKKGLASSVPTTEGSAAAGSALEKAEGGEGRRRKRGEGDPGRAATVISEALATATGQKTDARSGKGLRDFYQMNDGELTDVCAQVDGGTRWKEFRQKWHVRVGHLFAVPGGDDFLCAALTHLRKTVREKGTQGRGEIRSPGAWLNSRTAGFLSGKITKEDL